MPGVANSIASIAAIIFLCCSISQHAAAQQQVVQITGVVMTADSLRAVGNSTVQVKGKNRGVVSSDRGVFSIVCMKGDTLQFSALGYSDKEYPLPADIRGDYFTLIQLLVQDTFYLPETIVRPLPSKEFFEYAFRNWKIPDDKYAIAQRNVNVYTLRALAAMMPRDGGESQSAYQTAQANDAVYYGQQKPNNLFSPLAWGEFFDAWKRGDFRKKY